MQLDVEALYVVADRKRRQEEKLDWSNLARQLGLKPDTLLKLQHGRPISLPTLLVLLEWLDETDLTPYAKRDRPKPSGP